MMTDHYPVYLDHSATTPTDPRVLQAMLPYFGVTYGNAASAHTFGRNGEDAVETARETIAKRLNCRPREIIFTSGGSEADNLALRGAAWKARQVQRGNHFVSTSVEHSAIDNTVKQLVDVMGFQHSYLSIDSTATFDTSSIDAILRADTFLVSAMLANNEVGTILPIADLALAVKPRGILVHTDAVQAAGQLHLDVKALGVDMMSLSAHKFYGPKGVGLLYVRDGLELVPTQSGGNHEEGRRAGTLNTPGIVGMAHALELAYQERDYRVEHFVSLREHLIDGIMTRVTDVVLTGHRTNRLPSHASFVFDGIDGNTLVTHLDMRGVAASSASACKTGNPEPSSVLLAMGYTAKEALGSLRLTVGVGTTHQDIDYTINVVSDVVMKLRKLKRELAL